ncbi:MAG: DNA-processing protein DprA [Dehalococcoidia bacterium]|nr:DNA-processing protein DprA [Dehalococcoidia bacterium]MDD5493098.1 DNA-processing protein DprA [Dehalococcoidia bacterium]
MKKDLQYWVGFSKIPGIGRAKIALLKDRFKGLEYAWKASLLELTQAGLDPKHAEIIVHHRSKINLDQEIDLLEKFHVDAITYESAQYPKLLKEAGDCPPVIYIRGQLKPGDECSLAVVGTRRSTAYGRQVTEDLVTDLARNNIVIVSGLAKGIDSIAHRTALDVSGRTIAVFACGLDIVYPPENIKLAREISEKGALVSEYPLGTKPKADNFPRRNRILSGLSLGVLVIESGEKGGALITAKSAIDQNREVFAVPGNIYSLMSKGSNKLIQEGEAKLVRNFMDVIEELNLNLISQQLEMKETVAENEIESIIIKCLKEEPIHVDEICRQTGLETSNVISNLALMELKGSARPIGNMCYILNNKIK